MKLLLTSGGVRNSSISTALLELVGKPASETKIVCIPTAANVEGGNKDWFVGQFINLWRYGFCWIDVVDPSAANVTDWQERLSVADVVFISGGNTFHLLEQAKKTGLFEWLKDNIESKVYVGSSAGSLLATPTIALAAIAGGDQNLTGLTDLAGLHFVPFEFAPHVPNSIAPEDVSAYAHAAKHPIYAVDDTTAIKVADGKTEVISEGAWQIMGKK